MLKGMIADTKVENIFYCDTDEYSITSETDFEVCKNCGLDMENIGWIESGQKGQMADVVAKYIAKRDLQKSGSENDMGKKEEEGVITSDDTVPGSDSETQPTEVFAPEEPEVEKAVSVDETDTESNTEFNEPSIEKMFGDIKESLDASMEELRKNRGSIDEVEENLRKEIAALNENFEKRVDELESKFTEFNSKLREQGSQLESFDSQTQKMLKRLDGVEGSTALRKSAGVEPVEAEETKKTSPWGGVFLGSLDD